MYVALNTKFWEPGNFLAALNRNTFQGYIKVFTFLKHEKCFFENGQKLSEWKKRKTTDGFFKFKFN